MPYYNIMLFPGGCEKALTLSYDDGTYHDERLVSILDKYKIKGTFHLNSGMLLDDDCVREETAFSFLHRKDIKSLFQNHEVAIHTRTHPWLDKIPLHMAAEQVLSDKLALEKLVEYPVRGMSYPFGAYNQQIVDLLKTLGVAYSRTTENDCSFSLPANPLMWKPTCHHINAELFEHVERFFGTKKDNPSLFYLWGHSYEFFQKENWDLIERFCDKVSGNENIWYATNIEIIDYINAYNRLHISTDGRCVHNPSAVPVWLLVNSQKVEIPSGAFVKL